MYLCFLFNLILLIVFCSYSLEEIAHTIHYYYILDCGVTM